MTERLPLLWRYRSAVACVIIPLLVNTISFATVARRLSRRPARHSASFDDATLADWVTNFLLRLPDPWYPTCLRRSAVLFHLLRRAGRSVHLCLGVQRSETGEIDAHAWLVLDEQPYIEPASTDPTRYKLIARFPDDGTQAQTA